MGSHSREALLSTNTSPEEATSKRLMSFRQVVLPEPLRPNSIRVSPRCTVRFSPESSTFPDDNRYSTLQNSIALFTASPIVRSAVVTEVRHWASAYQNGFIVSRDAVFPSRLKQKGHPEVPFLIIFVRG